MSYITLVTLRLTLQERQNDWTRNG